MYPVKYHRAGSAKEAQALMKKAKDGKYLAGGQTLLATMKQRLAAPSDLVDIGKLKELKGIKIAGRTVTIGAATTHGEIAANAKLAKLCPAVTHLASRIGDPAVRAMGTIGGSIANNDPAADWPAAMLGLGATIVTSKRKLPADKFFTGLFETALADGELVTAVTFEAPARAAYRKFPNPASRYAMAGVFVSDGKGGARVAVTGAGSDGVFRHAGMEAALRGKWSPDAIDGEKVDERKMLSDLHGDAKYRANLVKVMAKRAVADAR
jgi:carbon-monoxide dehydrogenase medium subunit